MKNHHWINREDEARDAGRLYIGTTSSIAGDVFQTLTILGNNCRLQGMDREGAENVLLKIEFDDTPPEDSNWRPSDHFWDAFLYGTQTEIVRVNNLVPHNS